MMVPAVTEACSKTRWPARREQILDASCLIRETAVELDQRAGKVGQGGLPTRGKSAFCSIPEPCRYNILYPRTQRDKPSHGYE
jgi:hypothetical protein